MMRSCRRALTLSITVASCAATAGVAAGASLVGPYLQSPTETSMTVVWLTERPSSGWVEYGLDDSLGTKVFAAEDGLKQANVRLHRVVLAGLAPGTTYRYRAVSREIVDFQPYKVVHGETVTADARSFRTLDRRQDRCSFVVLNDNHERTELLRARLALAAERPYDLAFYNGDMLDHTDSEAQIVEKVLGPSAELFAGRVPFVWVRGNHEARGTFARELKSYVASPNGRYYYSFDHGPVRFIVLDSGEDKPDGHPEYGELTDFDAYREAEAQWLKAEVESEGFRAAPFRVVLVHQPPFVLERSHNHGREHATLHWGPLLNRGVDLMVAAHVHRFRMVEPVPGVHDYPIVVGGGPKPGQGTVIRVDADAARLELSVVGDDGVSIATRTVRRR
jgi:acid phosphatase type 7